MKFRLDIQILRGLAVLFIVLFHLGFNFIKSGFLGVDIFFVISGFLMTILYDKKNKVTFITRRAKRLLPAYYTVIIITLVSVFIFNTPNQANQVINQTLFSTGYASNIGFWLQNSYFSKSQFTPLLHLWSLGVEIQFYLIIPVLFWFFTKNKYLLLFTIVASLLLCFFMIGISPKTSFFMMPLRLWEFLIGYFTAYYLTNNGAIKISNFKWLGGLFLLGLILIPLFKVDGQSLSFISGHPGLFSLVVCIFTMGVLILGLPRFIIDSYLGKFLIFVGKYSYSIYLVHFPILVIYLSTPFKGTNLAIPSTLDIILLVFLIGSSSYFLYNFVELKFNKINFKKLIFMPSSIIIILVTCLPFLQNNFFSEKENNIFSAFTDRSTYRCGRLIQLTDPKSISILV